MGDGEEPGEAVDRDETSDTKQVRAISKPKEANDEDVEVSERRAGMTGGRLGWGGGKSGGRGGSKRTGDHRENCFTDAVTLKPIGIRAA